MCFIYKACESGLKNATSSSKCAISFFLKAVISDGVKYGDAAGLKCGDEMGGAADDVTARDIFAAEEVVVELAADNRD